MLLLLVNSQSSHVAEFKFTIYTLMLKNFYPMYFLMLRKISFLTESHSAFDTFERLLFGVYFQMILQVPFIWESTLTPLEYTLYSLLGFTLRFRFIFIYSWFVTINSEWSILSWSKIWRKFEFGLGVFFKF